MKLIATAALLSLSAACAQAPVSSARYAHLGAPDGDPEGFAVLREAFEDANPGYRLRHHAATGRLEADDAARIAFVQAGEARARVYTSAGEHRSDVAVGDVICLRPGRVLEATPPVQLLVFALPDDLPLDLPTFIRPDWDPRITDTPGGCATEEGAYRRILLTWLPKVGPYVFHGLNAHRVRIQDSFTHYHPLEGGFDELYLVQMVQPGARVLTSDAVGEIEAREVDAERASDLFESRELEVGDLVYLPRGTIHRGLGGALAQVITVPGFRPGAEVGVDHHLRAIQESLELPPALALPYNVQASEAPVIR